MSLVEIRSVWVSLMMFGEAMHVKAVLIVLMRIYKNVCGLLRKCEVGKWYAIYVKRGSVKMYESVGLRLG
jgi:hypothetical protein